MNQTENTPHKWGIIINRPGISFVLSAINIATITTSSTQHHNHLINSKALFLEAYQRCLFTCALMMLLALVLFGLYARHHRKHLS
jgi:hypothetical protein